MYIPTIADNDRRDALHSEYVTTSKYEARIPTSQQCKRLTQGVSEALIQREKEERRLRAKKMVDSTYTPQAFLQA